MKNRTAMKGAVNLTAIALLATLHAPLHAGPEGVAKDAAQPERATATIDQRALVKTIAEQSLRDAKASIGTDIAVELATSIGKRQVVTIADAD